MKIKKKMIKIRYRKIIGILSLPNKHYYTNQAERDKPRFSKNIFNIFNKDKGPECLKHNLCLQTGNLKCQKYAIYKTISILHRRIPVKETLKNNLVSIKSLYIQKLMILQKSKSIVHWIKLLMNIKTIDIAITVNGNI